MIRTLSDHHQYSPDIASSENQVKYVSTQNGMRATTETDSPNKKSSNSNETETQLRKAIEKLRKFEEEQEKMKEVIRRKGSKKYIHY